MPCDTIHHGGQLGRSTLHHGHDVHVPVSVNVDYLSVGAGTSLDRRRCTVSWIHLDSVCQLGLGFQNSILTSACLYTSPYLAQSHLLDLETVGKGLPNRTSLSSVEETNRATGGLRELEWDIREGQNSCSISVMEGRAGSTSEGRCNNLLVQDMDAWRTSMHGGQPAGPGQQLCHWRG